MTKHILNKSYFENVDNEKKAYWLGFLYGDGNISKNKRQLTLVSKDREHLEKFKRDLDCDYEIKPVNKIHRIIISSTKICKDLIQLGCVPHKTFKLEKIPDIQTDLIRHFIRGLFDADGCIYKRKYGIGFTIRGNPPLLKDIQNYLWSFAIVSSKTKINNRNLYYSGINALLIFEHLYDNSIIYLSRKYNNWCNYN